MLDGGEVEGGVKSAEVDGGHAGATVEVVIAVVVEAEDSDGWEDGDMGDWVAGTVVDTEGAGAEAEAGAEPEGGSGWEDGGSAAV